MRERLPERLQVSRDLEEVREQAVGLPKRRAFHAEGTINATETITIHTVTKTLQTDQSLPDRNKRELHRYFTSWRLTPKPLRHLPT